MSENSKPSSHAENVTQYHVGRGRLILAGIAMAAAAGATIAAAPSVVRGIDETATRIKADIAEALPHYPDYKPGGQ